MASKCKGWKVGDQFKVKQNYNGYVVGTVYSINGVTGSNVCGMTEDGMNLGQYVPKSYLVHLSCTKADLTAEQVQLQNQLDCVAAKLAFLAVTKSAEYDEDEFKVYQALT